MARYLLTMSDDLAVTYGLALALLLASGVLTLLILQLRHYFLSGGFSLSDLSLMAHWVGSFRAPVSVELLGTRQATRLDLATFVTFSAVFSTALSLLKLRPVARGGVRQRTRWQEQWNAGLLYGQIVLVLLWFPVFARPWTGAKTVAWLIEVSLGMLVVVAAVLLPTTNLRETTDQRHLRLQEMLTKRKEKYERFDAALRQEIEAREDDFRAVRVRRRWVAAVWGIFVTCIAGLSLLGLALGAAGRCLRDLGRQVPARQDVRVRLLVEG